MKLTEEIKNRIYKDFKETAPEIDTEISWAIFNGLVISYLKAQGNKDVLMEQDKLKEAVKCVILSLPKYAYGFKAKYNLDETFAQYFDLCPEELRKDLTKEISEEYLMKIAAQVVEFSAEKGIHEDGKMTIADAGVSKKVMDEFVDTAAVMELMHDRLLNERGEEGLLQAVNYYKDAAEKAVKEEIKYHADNANYLVKFYSGILLYMKEEEAAAMS